MDKPKPTEKSSTPPSPNKGDFKVLDVKDNITPGTNVVIQERMKQVGKGYTPQWDFENNNPGTLIEAARAITYYDIDDRIKYKPRGWKKDLWDSYCHKTEKERLAIASAWLIGELDRYYYYEKLKQGNKE